MIGPYPSFKGVITGFFDISTMSRIVEHSPENFTISVQKQLIVCYTTPLMLGKELSGMYLNHDESAAPLTTGDELPLELGDVLPELGIQEEIEGKEVGEVIVEEGGEKRDESLEVRDEGVTHRKGILGTRRRKLAFFTPFVAIAGIWAISNFHPVSSGDNAPPQTPTPTDIPNFVPPATSQEVVRAIVLPEKKLNPLDLPGVLKGFTVYSPSLSEGTTVLSEKEWIACYGLLPTFQSASQQMVIDGKNIGDDILQGLGPHAGERVLASAALYSCLRSDPLYVFSPFR
jgi:hypothetical protein